MPPCRARPLDGPPILGSYRHDPVKVTHSFCDLSKTSGREFSLGGTHDAMTIRLEGQASKRKKPHQPVTPEIWSMELGSKASRSIRDQFLFSSRLYREQVFHMHSTKSPGNSLVKKHGPKVSLLLAKSAQQE